MPPDYVRRCSHRYCIFAALMLLLMLLMLPITRFSLRMIIFTLRCFIDAACLIAAAMRAAAVFAAMHAAITRCRLLRQMPLPPRCRH